ncbi:MAG: hypothetical protein ACLFSV_11575 [Alkalispirochaeta sp.]
MDSRSTHTKRRVALVLIMFGVFVLSVPVSADTITYEVPGGTVTVDTDTGLGTGTSTFTINGETVTLTTEWDSNAGTVTYSAKGSSITFTISELSTQSGQERLEAWIIDVFGLDSGGSSSGTSSSYSSSLDPLSTAELEMFQELIQTYSILYGSHLQNMAAVQNASVSMTNRSLAVRRNAAASSDTSDDGSDRNLVPQRIFDGNSGLLSTDVTADLYDDDDASAPNAGFYSLGYQFPRQRKSTFDGERGTHRMFGLNVGVGNLDGLTDIGLLRVTLDWTRTDYQRYTPRFETNHIWINAFDLSEQLATTMGYYTAYTFVGTFASPVGRNGDFSFSLPATLSYYGTGLNKVLPQYYDADLEILSLDSPLNSSLSFDVTPRVQVKSSVVVNLTVLNITDYYVNPTLEDTTDGRQSNEMYTFVVNGIVADLAGYYTLMTGTAVRAGMKMQFFPDGESTFGLFAGYAY